MRGIAKAIGFALLLLVALALLFGFYLSIVGRY